MLTKRVAKNELFLLKANVSRSLRKKDFLRNLHVGVSFRGDQILIRLETETLLIFLAGFLPFIALFFDKPLGAAIISSIIVWTMGYIGKVLLLNSIKRDLELYLLMNI